MSKRPLSPTTSSIDKRSRHDSTEFLSQYASTYRFRLGNPNQLVITNDGAAILFLRASSSRSFTHDLWQFIVETQQESVICTAEQILSGASDTLNDEEKQRRERMRQASRGIASFRVAPNGHTILIPLSSHLYLVDRITHDIRMITTSSHAYPNYPTFSRDAKWVSCVRDGDIWIHSTIVDGVEYRLTKRVGEHITYGTAEFVAQEEMSRFSGYWWSPDSQHLCYQQTDTTGMEMMHISDPTSPEKPPSIFSYPRPGKKNASVTLAIVDISTCRHEKLTEDRKDGHMIPDPIWVSWNQDTHPYLTTVKWSSRAPLTCCVQNREQTELIVYSIDHITGKTTEIHVERDSKWLNIDQDVPHYLPDGYHFLWTTEREGAWQLELRDRSGRRLRALTDPSLGFRKLLGVFPKHACCYVAASQDPTQQHIYKVQLGVIPPVTTSGGETSPLQLSSPRPPTSVTIPLSPTNSSPLLTAAAMPTLVSAAASSPSSSPLSSPCAPSTTSLHPPSSPSLNAVSSSPRSALHVPPSPSTQSASSLSSSPMPAIALTRDPGIHNATFLAHHDLYIHECVTLTHPIITTIRRLDGTAIATLTSVAEKPTSLPNVELVTVHEKKFHAAVIKPHDWVEGKKYPVIVYVYGGPCFRVITHDCSQYLIQQWLANHGYVVVSLDGRGTPYRGRDWERAIYHNLIRVPLQDQCEGLQALGQLCPYLDLTRVGIYGWSFGGYFSAHAVMQRPDVFRAGVAGAPVAAWEDYDTHYTERYLAHGTADDNVYFAHALKMSNTLFRAKREHDFLPLVDFTHMVTDPVINIALYTRILNHFEKHVHHITSNNDISSTTSH